MSSRVCISLCAPDVAEMLRQIRLASGRADLIEIRCDCLGPADGYRLIDSLPSSEKTFIVTFRPREQGGRNELTRDERLGFWNHVARSLDGNFLVDIEEDLAQEIDLQRILSYHDFDRTTWNDADISSIWNRLARHPGGHIIKIAVNTGDAVDAIPVWNLLARSAAARRETTAIAMGEAGKWTRILGPAHGSYLTYASLDADTKTADGQLTADELNNICRIKQITKKTKVYGVIGSPVTHSLSPIIHNAAFASAGIDAVFIPFEVKDIGEFVRRFVAKKTREVELNFGGFAVTMPHKQTIIENLDSLDGDAAKIGAVNTIVIDNDRLIGHNSDAHGFITPLLQRVGAVEGWHAAVFGTGGAARAVIISLVATGVNVTVFGRNQRALADLSEISNLKFEIWNPKSTIQNPKSFDLIVNATPLGMNGELADANPLADSDLAGVKLVYDLVTRESDTPMIAAAKSAGVETISGIEMLIAQAVRQFSLWTGKDISADVMSAAVREHYER